MGEILAEKRSYSRLLYLAAGAAICAALIYGAAALKIRLPVAPPVIDSQVAVVVIKEEPPPEPPPLRTPTQKPTAKAETKQEPARPTPTAAEKPAQPQEPGPPPAAGPTGPVGPVVAVVERAVPLGAAIAPTYPERAIDRLKSGSVRLALQINPDGTVAQVTLLAEDPKGWGFGDAAVKAAKKTKFKPKTVDGKAVASEFFYSYEFRLQ